MKSIIGIDIGSVALSVVVINLRGAVICICCKFHRGAIADTLRTLLNSIDIRQVSGIAMTRSGPEPMQNIERCHTQIAIIAAVKCHHADMRRWFLDVLITKTLIPLVNRKRTIIEYLTNCSTSYSGKQISIIKNL